MSRKRKARSISIVTLSALALTFQACGEDEEAYCVDQFDTVVENENCYADEADGDIDTFFWYFGHTGGRIKTRGTKVMGGEKIAASNTAALQSRGGFGTSARTSGIGRVSAGS